MTCASVPCTTKAHHRFGEHVSYGPVLGHSNSSVSLKRFSTAPFSVLLPLASIVALFTRLRASTVQLSSERYSSEATLRFWFFLIFLFNLGSIGRTRPKERRRSIGHIGFYRHVCVSMTNYQFKKLTHVREYDVSRRYSSLPPDEVTAPLLDFHNCHISCIITTIAYETSYALTSYGEYQRDRCFIVRVSTSPSISSHAFPSQPPGRRSSNLSAVSMIEHLRHPLVASAEHRSEEVEVGNGLPLPTTASWPLISNNLRMFLERRSEQTGASIRSPMKESTVS